MHPQLLLHIGYHKTATTWMQRQLFVPEHGYFKVAGHDEVAGYITEPHGYFFDPEPLIAQVETAMAGIPEGGAAVISSELLCGNPIFGGRESDVFAERLFKIFPGAKILISIRAQLSVLPSIYMQYVSRGGTMTPRQFFDEESSPGYPHFSAKTFEYDRLVSHYQRLFGSERVFILPQEALKSDMYNALGALADFSGNRLFSGLIEGADRVRMASYPEYSAAILRRINHFQASVLNPNPVVAIGETPGGLYRGLGYILKQPAIRSAFGNHRPISRYVRKNFSGRFSESNARLSSLTGNTLDLSAYRG